MKMGPLLTVDLNEFIANGGYLRYVPSADADGKTIWELFGVDVDSKVRPVWVNGKNQRVFKSADALLAFHCRIYKVTSLLISTVDVVDTEVLKPPKE